MKKIITALGAVAGVIIIIAVGVTFILSPVSGSPPTSRMINLTERATGTTISLQVGDELHIQLEENPSTGYQWNYTIPDAFSVPEDKFSMPEGSGIPGQGGIHTWILKAEQKGTYELNWIYKRSWESTASDRPFTLTVVIT